MPLRTFVLACSLLAAVVFAAPGASSQDEVRYDGHRVVRALPVNRRQVERILQLSPDLWSHGIAIGRTVDFRLPAETWDEWLATGIGFEIVIEDVQALIDEQANRPINPLGGDWFDDYKTLSQHNDYLDALAAFNPDIAQVVTVGTSLEGRPIKGLRISNAGSGAPSFVMQGCQHAREWITPMVCQFVADYLVRNYGIDDEVTRLVDDVVWYIIPIVNVDGYEYSWTTDRMWRKNRRDNGNGTFGVDLNRNWSVGWGGEGSSGNTGSETYRGTAPFSEPESTAVRDYVLSLSNRAVFLDVHSYSQLILAPYGYTSDLPPDHDLYQYLGAEMQQRIFDVHGMTYVHGPTYTTIYPAAGVAGDWGYEAAGAIGFGFELRDTGQTGFLLPPEQIIPNGEEFVPAMLFLADFVSIAIAIDLVGEAPATILPNTPTPIQASVVGMNGNTLDPDSVTLWWRQGSEGGYAAETMTALGGDTYEADLPATPCGQTVDFYFEASTIEGDTVTLPANAPDSAYQTLATNVTDILIDDFETNLGWTTENISLTDGPWERAIPAGGGDRGDPPSDYDGSGFCYVTDNADGNSDVDGGPTRLISPTVDLASNPEAAVSFACWFFNDDNDGDRLDVHVSNDNGATWTLVEAIGNTSGWASRQFRVADYITPTAQVKVRFSATDNPNDSVTEAGIDAFSVTERSCGDTVLVSFDVTFGTLMSGGLAELMASDDARVRVRSRIGFSVSEANVLEMRIGAETNVQNPSFIDLAVEGRLNQPGGISRLRLRNWSTNAFQQVHQYQIGSTEFVETVEDISAANRVRGNDGRIELSIRQSALVVFTASGFDSFTDWVEIAVE
jgi:murein tripeptide amidase MpaA